MFLYLFNENIIFINTRLGAKLLALNFIFVNIVSANNLAPSLVND
jgi:hypothetical protein